MSEESLEKEIAEYQKLAANDKKIDIASLTMSALQSHQSNHLPEKQKRWAYLISLVVPPFGLLFAIKFFLTDKDDAKQAAVICIVLTVISITLTVLFMKALLSGSGTSLEQIQQINPEDYQDLLQ